MLYIEVSVMPPNYSLTVKTSEDEIICVKIKGVKNKERTVSISSRPLGMEGNEDKKLLDQFSW